MHNTDASAPHQINIKICDHFPYSSYYNIESTDQESMDLITDWLKNYEMKWNVHCLK